MVCEINLQGRLAIFEVKEFLLWHLQQAFPCHSGIYAQYVSIDTLIINMFINMFMHLYPVGTRKHTTQHTVTVEYDN